MNYEKKLYLTWPSSTNTNCVETICVPGITLQNASVAHLHFLGQMVWSTIVKEQLRRKFHGSFIFDLKFWMEKYVFMECNIAFMIQCAILASYFAINFLVCVGCLFFVIKLNFICSLLLLFKFLSKIWGLKRFNKTF